MTSSSLNSDDGRPSLLSSWQAVAYPFIPGAVQGGTTVLLGHPLDTAKTRLQTSSCNAAADLPKAIREIVQREGVMALYRGVTPPIVMVCTKRSLQFALFETFFASDKSSSAVSKGKGKDSSDDEEAGGIIGAVRRRLAASAFLSGALAGVAGTVLGCPMHVVKIQTQNTTRDVTSNAWSCAVRIARAEGLRGFYRGLRFHMLKDACFASTYLGSYKNLTSKLKGKDGNTLWWAPIVCGSVASMLTWTLLYPLDTAKTLVQAKQAQSIREMYSTLFPATPASGPTGLRELASRVLVMYRGLGVALARAGPVSGAAMFAYESAKKAVASVSSPATVGGA